ncbi:hypothetical protein [Bacillus cereus]|nr:hypothetical protein [Bacillus cereus]
MLHNYTSNVSPEQFELIREDLEHAQWIYMRCSGSGAKIMER